MPREWQLADQQAAGVTCKGDRDDIRAHGWYINPHNRDSWMVSALIPPASGDRQTASDAGQQRMAPDPWPSLPPPSPPLVQPATPITAASKDRCTIVAVTQRGQTTLSAAAEEGRGRVVRVLLEKSNKEVGVLRLPCHGWAVSAPQLPGGGIY